jgi:endonuclease-3
MPRAKKKSENVPAASPRSDKKPFDVETAIPLLREAVAPYPKAALFELYAEGHTSVFEILIACVISIRTHYATVSTQPHWLVLVPALGHADVN